MRVTLYAIHNRAIVMHTLSAAFAGLIHSGSLPLLATSRVSAISRVVYSSWYLSPIHCPFSFMGSYHSLLGGCSLTTQLQKTASPSSTSQKLPLSPQLGGRASLSPPLLCARALNGLLLCRSWARNHSYHEFMSGMSLSGGYYFAAIFFDF